MVMLISYGTMTREGSVKLVVDDDASQRRKKPHRNHRMKRHKQISRTKQKANDHRRLLLLLRCKADVVDEIPKTRPCGRGAGCDGSYGGCSCSLGRDCDWR